MRFPPELALRSTGCTCRQINRLLSTGVKCFGAKSTRTIYSSYPHPRAESSFITHNRLRLSLHSSSLVRSTRRYRHDTDVCYPRENCIAPESGICVGTYIDSKYDYPHKRDAHCTQEGHRRDGGSWAGMWSRDRSASAHRARGRAAYEVDARGDTSKHSLPSSAPIRPGPREWVLLAPAPSV